MDLFGLDKEAQAEKGIEHLMTVFSQEELTVVLSVLNDADIPFLIKERGAGGVAKVIMGFNMYGTDIYVRAEDLEVAEGLFDFDENAASCEAEIEFEEDMEDMEDTEESEEE